MSINNASIDERIVATQLVDALLRRGYPVSVFDSEEETVTDSTDRAEILDALNTADDDTISGGVFSYWLVYGQGGDELIADYSYSEGNLAEADAIHAEALAMTNNH